MSISCFKKNECEKYFTGFYAEYVGSELKRQLCLNLLFLKHLCKYFLS